MVGRSESGCQIHTFTVTELKTIYEVVEERYLEDIILNMAKDVFGNGPNTGDDEI